MQRQLGRLNEVPEFLRPWAQSMVLRRVVPFTGTAGLEFVSLTPGQVEVAIANHRRVQNHIGGVHASAMNLLAETATGMVVGMNVRDDCLPLAKELRMAFRKRATGSLRAVATLTEEQRAAMRSRKKGEVKVAVIVTDEAGVNPVECEFIWAWIPSRPSRAEHPHERRLDADAFFRLRERARLRARALRQSRTEAEALLRSKLDKMIQTAQALAPTLSRKRDRD